MNKLKEIISSLGYFGSFIFIIILCCFFTYIGASLLVLFSDKNLKSISENKSNIVNETKQDNSVKTDDNNYYNSNNSSSSNTNSLEYCKAYGCARKEAYSGAKYCSTHLTDKNAQTPVSDNSSNYSNHHKCEYSGCNNYASGTKYCSKHNQTKCSKIGCSNTEAYSGAKYCTKHLYESIERKSKYKK